MITRRQMLMLSFFSLGCVALPSRHSRAQELKGPRRPDPATLEAGDLVWPKKDGAYVPYHSTTDASAIQTDEERWKRDKVEFIRRARSGQLGKTPDAIIYWKRVAEEIEFLSFETFYHRYSAGSSPNDFITYGGAGILYVGHVGIIDVDSSTKTPFVIEAISGTGIGCSDCVQRVSYEEWLKNRGDILVWHARLKNRTAVERGEITKIAQKHLGQRYDFWNFDLSDTSGFYCSKLVWLAVRDATGIVLDEIPDPQRFFWFSPLQTMRSRHLALLSNPGNYRNV